MTRPGTPVAARFRGSRVSKGTTHSDGILFPVTSTSPFVAAGAGGNLRSFLGITRPFEPPLDAGHQPSD